MADLNFDTTTSEVQSGTGSLKLNPQSTEVVTISNGLLVPDGTKSEPAVRFSDDDNTGIYSPTNDQIALTGQGEDALLVTGVASSVNVLEIKPSITTDPLLINATGTDSNIDVNIVPKGAGKLKSGGTDVSLSGHNHSGTYIESETDPVFTAWDKSTGISITESQISDFGDYATSTELTDGLATKSDTTHDHTGVYEPADADIQTHLSSTSNPHSVTADQVLPTQTGNSGKYLTTDGTNSSWGTVSGGAATWGTITGTLSDQTDLQSALDGKQASDAQLTDIAGMSPTKGHLIVGNGTNFVNLGVGTNDQVLTADSAQTTGVKWGTAAGGGGATGYLYSGTITTAPVALGEDSLVIGDGASVISSKINSIAIGKNAYCSENSTIAIGAESRATSLFSLRIGSLPPEVYQVTNGGAISIGGRGSGALETGQVTICSDSGSSVIYPMSGTETIAINFKTGSACSGHNSIFLNSAGYLGGTNFTKNQSIVFTTGSSTLSTQDNQILMGTGFSSTRYGDVVFNASGHDSGQGYEQVGRVTYRGTTANNSPLEIYLKNATNTKRCTLDSNAIWKFTSQILAVATAGSVGVSTCWTVEGLIKNIGGTVTLVGTPTQIGTRFNDGAASSWTAEFAADDTNNSLKVSVTGETGYTIRWLVSTDYVQIRY